MMASIGNVALNVLFTIDAPLLFCWTGALYVLWRLVEKPEAGSSRMGWAVALVLLLGCGVLSKQMMLAFWGMGLIFLALDKPSRRYLKHPVTWLVVLAALLFLLPPLWWNWQNEWITFVHMEDHFQPGKTDLVEILLRPVVFIGLQIALGSPITGVLLFGLLAALVVSRRPRDRRERYLLTFSLPGLIVVLLMSLRQNINPNWPAVYFPSAYILLGAWGVGALTTQKGFERLRWLFKPGVYLGAVLAVLVYVMPFIVKAGGWEGLAKDPGRRMEGWSEAGRRAGAYYADFPGDKPELVIAGGHRHTAAEFAFYLPGQPRVYRWFPGDHVESQYEIWGGPDNARGKDALILWPGHVEVLPPDLQSAFGKTRRLGAFTVQPDTKNAKNFTAFAGTDFKEWKP